MRRDNFVQGYSHDLYSLQNLGVGEHVCSLYESEDDFRVSIVEFIQAGVKFNNKIVYVCDQATQQRVLLYLNSANIETASLVKRGQLNFITMDETAFQKQPYTPEQMVSVFEKECIQAEKQGYAALRVTGDVRWFLRKFPDIEHLFEFEYQVNTKIANRYKYIGMCQYDLKFFSPEFLNKVIEIHPVCHICTSIYPNQFYIPPEIYKSPEKEREILNQRIYQIKERKDRESTVAALFKKTEELREFSYMLAHDLKEPIKNAAIMNDLLQTSYIDHFNEEAKKVFARIGQALDEAFTRVEALKDLSLVANEGKGLSVLKLHEVIQNVITYYEQNITDIPCKFDLNIEDDICIRADKAHLNQLFFNLVDNAFKYRNKDQLLIISISAKKVVGQGTEIIVADNGVGFDAADKQQIFQPFKRLSPAISSPGAGIGLTICQRIMAKYFGEISAQGQAGVGAAFTLRFPEDKVPF